MYSLLGECTAYSLTHYNLQGRPDVTKVGCEVKYKRNLLSEVDASIPLFSADP